jgi:hypothetical protein
MNILTTPELFFFYHIYRVLDMPIHICPEGATFETTSQPLTVLYLFSLIEIIINQKHTIIVKSSRIIMNSIMYYLNSTTQPTKNFVLDQHT